MDSHAVAVARSAALWLLLVTAAACGPISGSAPPAGAATPAETAAAASIALPPSINPVATQGPGLTPEPSDGPPVALLSGTGVTGAAGDLGSFSWEGLVSDAPWIVGPRAASVPPGSPLIVAFRPNDATPAGWRARWAPVTDEGPGTPADGGSGTGPVIEVVAPTTTGSWSLQVTADFGPGRSVTWYWRIEVAP